MSGPYANDLSDMLVGQIERVAVDFGDNLSDGITLTGTPTLTVTVLEGDEDSPGARFGAPTIGTQARPKGTGVENGCVFSVFSPLKAGLYLIVAECQRSDGVTLPKGQTHIRVVDPE